MEPMLSVRNLLVIVALGLAGCDDTVFGGPRKTGTTKGSGIELTGVSGGSGGGAGTPVATVSSLPEATFSEPVVTDAVWLSSRSPTESYAPLISQVVGGVTLHPRWPKATVGYEGAALGLTPLTKAQRTILGENVDRMNLAIGRRVFKYLGDVSSADILIKVATMSAFAAGLHFGGIIPIPNATGSAPRFRITGRIELRSDLNDFGVRQVALHELAHAAGLDHTPSNDSMMCNGCDATHSSVVEFTKQEKLALNLLYTLP